MILNTFCEIMKMINQDATLHHTPRISGKCCVTSIRIRAALNASRLSSALGLAKPEVFTAYDSPVCTVIHFNYAAD